MGVVLARHDCFLYYSWYIWKCNEKGNGTKLAMARCRGERLMRMDSGSGSVSGGSVCC